MALSNLLGYKTKCYCHIFLVVLFSSELNLSWTFFHQYIFRNLFILVFSSVPRFFHYEYTHNELGNFTFVTTSLSRDKSYNQFWHAWQSLTSTFIPFTALGTINVKILWNLAKSKLNDTDMSQNDGLRILVGWESMRSAESTISGICLWRTFLSMQNLKEIYFWLQVCLHFFSLFICMQKYSKDFFRHKEIHANLQDFIVFLFQDFKE